MPLIQPDPQLLDPSFTGTSGIIQALNKMPVLRPYARLKILGSSDGTIQPFTIDDVQDPRTSKFMYLRTFEYSLMTGPEQVKVTLFSDDGKVREVLTNVYNAIERNTKIGAGGATFIEFDFGWSDFDDVDGTAPVRKMISSKKHQLQIMNVEISYEEGGIAYQIVGFDSMTHMQGIMSKKTYPMCDIREVITQFLAERGMNAPVFGTDEADSGPNESVKIWRTNGNDVLQIIKSWLYDSGGKSKRNRPLYIWWDSTINRVHIADVAMANAYSELLASDLAGPHQVNYWDPNETKTFGGSIVIKFKPKVSGLHQLKTIAQVSYMDGDKRMIHETLKSPEANNNSTTKSGNDDERKKGRGFAMHFPTGERLDPVNDEIKKEGLSDNVEGVMKNLGVNTPGAMNCMAEMDCIGWPRADNYFEYIERLIYLNVRLPYGLDHYANDEDALTWKMAGNDPMLTGYYRIKRLTHVIDDAGYRMRVELATFNSLTEPPLMPVGSPSQS